MKGNNRYLGRYLGRNSGRYLGRFLAAGLIVLLVLLAAFLLSAGTWLESESGRNLLQRELSKVLGLEADLRGEYALQLFPVIRIAGRDLALSDSGTGLTIVSVDAYELHLALRPLLRKQINIPKVAIHDSILDLDRLAEFNASRAAETRTDLQLPGIRNLEITGLKLQKSAVDFLLVSELNLIDFAENQKSRLAIGLAIDQATAASQNAHLQGVLQVRANPLELNLVVDELLLHLAEQSWAVGQGELNWSADQEKLWGELRGSLANYSSRYRFNVHLADTLQITLSVELQTADKESFVVNVEARDADDSWVFEMVELNLDGQQLDGTGCFSTTGEPLLQLQLQAKQLDLDALQDLLPASLFPVGPDVDGDEVTLEVSEDSEFPLQLAVALSAAQLSWSGTTASSVRLLIGAEPDCASDKDAGLN